MVMPGGFQWGGGNTPPIGAPRPQFPTFPGHFPGGSQVPGGAPPIQIPPMQGPKLGSPSPFGQAPGGYTPSNPGGPKGSFTPGGFGTPPGTPRPPRTPPNPGPGGYGFVPPSYQDMWAGKSRLPQPPMGPTDGMQYANLPSNPGAGRDFRQLGALAAHPMFAGMR